MVIDPSANRSPPTPSEVPSEVQSEVPGEKYPAKYPAKYPTRNKAIAKTLAGLMQAPAGCFFCFAGYFAWSSELFLPLLMVFVPTKNIEYFARSGGGRVRKTTIFRPKNRLILGQKWP